MGASNVVKEGYIAEFATKLVLFDIWILTAILRFEVFLKIYLGQSRTLNLWHIF